MVKSESRIAIIGMACRLPGGAHSPESLWSMLAEGRDGRKEVPKDRWDWKSFHNKNPETKDTTNFSHAYFLDDDVSAFDARFFNILGSDAKVIDPQQRLLLEVTYEALENAGLPIESMRGSDTSVHMAMFARDYDRMGYKDISQLDTGHIIGTGEAILANRISYILDLKGSSYTVDTGCSGGLVALHQACQTLRADEATVALAGASQLLLSPDQSVAMSQLTNKDGRCYTFDDRGAGYARGEGLGVLVLKRLDRAVADGDHIHAVMVESGVGHDGKTAGIFLPNGDAQEALARSVYARAGLDPRDTLFVESHGTGTVAGDNAEVGSIARVFGREAGRTSDLPVGSIKTNIGHLEAASGMAGAIKAIMVLKKNRIPPQLNYVNQKSTLRLEERGIKIPLELTPLTPRDHTGPRRVSVNSFGYGGTNAHAIIEGYDSSKLSHSIEQVNSTNDINGINGVSGDDEVHHGQSNGEKLIVLSANSESSLVKVVSNLRQWLASEQGQATSIDDLAYTLNTRRSKLLWRCSVVSSNIQELEEALADPKFHPTKSSQDVPVGFVFTGQGAQWFAMGRELLTDPESSNFASSIASCNHTMKSLGCEWDLIEELSRDEESSRLGEARFSQPITTAVQIALVDLLAGTYGIKPQAVCGHSSGEIAAAYAAGALSREAAMQVSYMRGICSAKAQTLNSVPGGMIAVGEGEDAVNKRIKKLNCANGKVTVACVNSPESTTVSGDLKAVIELEAALKAASVFGRRLKVDSAYHSHHMEAVASLYLSSLDGLTHGTPRDDVAFYSSVTGARKRSGFGPSYWTSNLVSQVKFSAASQLVAQDLSDQNSTAVPVLVEVGPHAALSGPLRQSLSSGSFNLTSGALFKYSYVPCLVRNTSAVRTALSLVGKLFESGSIVQIDGRKSRRRVVGNLPSYPWDHSKTYWRESRLSKGNRLRPFPPHDLLGLYDVNSSPYEPRWRYHISLGRIPWLRDHVIEGFVIFPGAGYLIMVIEAMKQLFQLRKTSGRITHINIRDTVIAKPVVIHDDSTKEAQEVDLQLIISPSRQHAGSPWEYFRIVSYDSESDSWVDNCSGLVSWDSAADGTADAQEDGLGYLTKSAAGRWLHDVQAACPTPVDVEETYRDMKASGNEYGETFQGLKEIHVGKGHATAKIVIQDITQQLPGHYMQPHTIHPSTFDSIFQVEPVCFRREGIVAPIMPTMLGEISVAVDMNSDPGSEILVAIKHHQQTPRDATFSYCAYQQRSDGTYRPVITGTDHRTQVVGEVESEQVAQKMTYRMDWKPVIHSQAALEGATVKGRKLTAKVHLGCSNDASQAAFGDALCRSLRGRGIECFQEAWSIQSSTSQEQDPDNLTIVIDTAENPLLLDPSLDTFEQVKSLLVNGGNILWISYQSSPSSAGQQAVKNMATGMARVLRRENAGLKLIMIDVQDPIQPCDDGPGLRDVIQNLDDIIESSFWSTEAIETEDIKSDTEYIIRDGKLMVPRVIPDDRLATHIDTRNNPEQQASGDAPLVSCKYLDAERPMKFEVQVPGLLKTIRFIDNNDMLGPLGPNEVQIEARAYGVNFKDVLIALGQMAPGTPMTGELAGVITAVGSGVQSWKIGDRVSAFFVTAFGNQVRVDSNNVVAIPDSISFADAASISLVYFTAWYCLTHTARLKKGQSVLIHAGSGGVGQSAIQLAQLAGAEVYTTVGSEAKKKLIQEQYGIPSSHILSSHAGKFKKQLLEATQGNGVDVVLNSLSGQSLRDSWDCLAPFGTFCEIGKADILGRGQLSMAKFDKQATFAAVDVYYMHQKRPGAVISGISEIFAIVDKGLLKPVFPVTTFDMSRIEEAFRLIAERKHVGKLVMTADEQTLVQAPKPKAPALQLAREGTYIIGGGLGDLGKKIGRYLTEKGAGHIVALTRRDADAVAQQPAVVEVREAIAKLGGTLHIVQCDIGDEKSTREAIEKMNLLGLPPVRGVIQSATVLRDRPFEFMELKDWKDSVRPKVQGTLNMHESFCSLETTEFFVMLSSVASIVGSASQSNYAAGNAFLDAFAHAGKQFSRGITNYATINVGAVEGSELVAGTLKQGVDVTRNIGSVSFDDVMAALEYAMNPQAREDQNIVQHLMHFNRDTIEDAFGPSALSEPMYDHVPSKRRQGDKTDAGGTASSKKQSVLQTVEQARTVAEAEEIVRQSLLEKFIAFIGDDIPDVPIATLGLDSLVSIELKNWIKHTFRAPLQISELSGAQSILALAKLIVSRMSLKFNNSNGIDKGNSVENVNGVNGVDSINNGATPNSRPMVQETDTPESRSDSESVTATETDSNVTSETLFEHGHGCCKLDKELPVQPLPDLDDTLDYWLEANEHLFKPEQLEFIHRDIETMRAPDSPARQILRDLYNAHGHDKSNGWFTDIVTDARFLCNRRPIAPWQSIMAAQRDNTGKRHSQVERAAIITSAALSYRHAMNAGEVEPLEIAGRPECTWGWKWLFNSTRVPQLGCDKIVNYTRSADDHNSHDHIAVLRKGHVFKVMLQDGDGKDVSLQQLQTTFEAIVARVNGDYIWSGLLTTDERDSWAKNRESLLAMGLGNVEYFHVLDSAMFVLCLDAGEPDTPEQIARQGYIGNGANRWFDKVLQFYVSANGRSGLITEHGILDGTTSSRLLEWISKAMEANPAGSNCRPSPANSRRSSWDIELNEVILQTTPEIEDQKLILREQYRRASSTSTYVREQLDEFGTDFLLQSRVPVKGAIDLTFQLALRLFFGRNMISWEPTSGALFHAGRPDAIQRATPAVNEFCDAAAGFYQDQDYQTDRATSMKMRALLLAASKSMNASMQVLFTGRSYHRVFEVLSYLWPTTSDTPKPAFLSDLVHFGRPSPPLYSQTASFEGDMIVEDFVHIMPDSDGFWSFICPEKNRILLSLTGGSQERTAAFVKELHRAARIMRDIVRDRS